MKINEKILIAGILSIVAAFCFSLWIFGENSISDFGLNAFTETLGIAATVFVIDYLIQRLELKRNLPQRTSAYEDVRLLTSRILSFWIDAARVSVPGPPPENIDVLLSEEWTGKIASCLHLDSMAQVTPKVPCWSWVFTNFSDFKERSNRILERHNGILDPKAYSYVHTLDRELMDPKMIQSIRQSDHDFGFPRPKVLGNYCFVGSSYFKTILLLMKWCKDEKIFLEEQGCSNLLAVTDTVHPWEPTDTPKCMIPMPLLQQQMNAVAEFRATHKRLDG